MDPVYLAALMHGEISISNKKPAQKVEEEKTPLQIDLEREIDNYVDKMELEEDITRTGLVPVKVKRDRLKLEMRKAAKLPKLQQQIDIAISLLFNEGRRFLSKIEFEMLESDFEALSTNLKEIDLTDVDDFSTEDLKELAGISDEGMQSITTIALTVFAEERYADCFALFALLSILSPYNAEYWFRMGIAAEKCADFEWASRAFKAGIEINPKHIGLRVLAADCNLRSHLFDEAKTDLYAAKEIIASQDVDPMWQDLIPALEERLSASSK